ncbi:MAG: hypothetical protein COA96_12110 [SAR86 cluster bacterium]|uniref:5'-Nucleotidase C-terminal domain-containing protein n=1 Tax=SAR86 cluster bacterium TaxID=2030880 RepID=A0A2A5AVH9_9GAMM|nr:MAG: hypothetical protein COA96_12110 [SAR86 cluster bacterium]
MHNRTAHLFHVFCAVVDSKPMFRFLLFVVLLTELSACRSVGSYAADVSDSVSDDSNIRELTVLYTNDEHGWMQGREPGKGAANLLGLWQEKEGYYEDGPFLLLSGGDHWTGPAISTWFEGEGMVEVMNAMHYDATAIGNHEFDFGLDNLQQRINQADFPYLAANIFRNDTQETLSDLGILASTIVETNGLRIAIIGLSTIYTPQTTNPVNVANLTFADYEPVLRKTVSSLDASSVDMIFVIAHVCMASLEPLANAVADLNISLMGGGHCNELVARQIGDTIMLESSGHYRSYARANFRYDIESNEMVSMGYAAVINTDGSANATIEQIISRWHKATEAELSSELGFLPIEIQPDDDRLQSLVVSSWLDIDRSADIAINNRLALRAPLPEGIITLADVVGLLPFENTIIAVQLTGAEILQIIKEGQRPFVAGMNQPLDEESTYKVLVNSFMYAGGAEYTSIAEFDDAGYDTEIHYRQPLVEWFQAQHSSIDNPLVFP